MYNTKDFQSALLTLLLTHDSTIYYDEAPYPTDQAMPYEVVSEISYRNDDESGDAIDIKIDFWAEDKTGEGDTIQAKADAMKLFCDKKIVIFGTNFATVYFDGQYPVKDTDSTLLHTQQRYTGRIFSV